MTDMQIFTDRLILRALEEDLEAGDPTTDGTIAIDAEGTAALKTREPLVLAGLHVFQRSFSLLNESMEFEMFYRDGEHVEKDGIICKVKGSMRTILKGERTALNFVQRMSGIATMTAAYVNAAGDYGVKILDTRKTVPGLRHLDKYSVRMGGGYNHRTGLYDGILIKDNHIAAAGSISAAVKSLKKQASHTLKIEVEAEDFAGLEEAIEAGADIVLLDNMSADDMKKAVELARGRVLLEASGGITIEDVNKVASTGVDMISVGALTHSVRAVDMTLEVMAS